MPKTRTVFAYPLCLAAGLCLALGVCVEGAETYEQSLPVRFDKLEGVVARANGLTLAGKIQQVAGRPVVIECENAEAVDLWGADLPVVREDAGGKLVVRHANGLRFQFSTVDAGTYRLRLRLWGETGYCGPASVGVDNQECGSFEPPQGGPPGGWFWVATRPFELPAGDHRVSIGGYTIFYGASLDRVAIATDSMWEAEKSTWQSARDGKTTSDGMGPAATPVTSANGFAESGWIPSDGVKRWISIAVPSVANGSAIRWLVRQAPEAQWQPAPSDLSSLDPKRLLQFRLEMDANPAGATPWVGPTGIRFEGAPRPVQLPVQPPTQNPVGKPPPAGTVPLPPVTWTGLTDGGGRVAAPNYELTFTADGRVSRLRLGTHDAIAPLAGAQGGGQLLAGNGTPLPSGKPELQPDGSVATRSAEACITWRFAPESVLIDTVAYRQDLYYLFPVPTNAVRIINARTGRDARQGGLYEKANPQIFFADGANLLADDEMQYGGGYGGRLDKDLFGRTGLTVGFWWNHANAWHKRLVLHARPTVGDALVISAKPIPPEADYRATEEVRLQFPAKTLFGLTFKGRAELSCLQQYADPPPSVVSLQQEVAIDEKEKPIAWSFKPPKPGLYQATMKLIGEEEVRHQLGCTFCFGMDRVPPPTRPPDFDEFWAQTMKKLAATPAELKRFKRGETPNGVDYLLSFKTINGWPAWAVLRVPKKTGPHPAMLLLPPVGSGPPIYGDFEDRVQLGVEVRGFAPALPPHEAAQKNVVSYTTPGEMKSAETRETMWLYYAYCTIARAYDLLAEQPEVDPKRIYITGVSQGGGLTLAAAALRPQNAGAVAVVPGLCRIDWRNSNGGGWGPSAAPGPERQRQLTDLSYFDDVLLVPRIRSRIAVAVGLLDDHTPPHAAIQAFYQLSDQVREKILLVNPWAGHHSWDEVERILPSWIAEDRSAQ